MLCRFCCHTRLLEKAVRHGQLLQWYHSRGGVYGYRYRDKDSATALNTINAENRINNSNIYRLVEAYRAHGHRKATIDPLGLQQAQSPPEILPERYGVTAGSQEVVDVTDIYYGASGRQQLPVSELVRSLETEYCGTIGAEFQHLQTEEEREWFAAAFETKHQINIPNERKIHLANLLLKSQTFDHYLASKFSTLKRYSGEGGESMMAVFDEIFTKSAQAGVEDIVICMPHRGRLNFLTCMLQFPPVRVFQKVTGHSEIPPGSQGTGDVLSHLYTSVELQYEGSSLQVSLIPNPSHLEANNPVTVGKTRSKQQTRAEGDYSPNGDSLQGDRTLCVQVHGDASFSAQGIIAETFCLAECPHYNVGGSVHFIVNNQLGFTTEAARGRSSLYCSDQAKINGYPVLHVNADYPEEVYMIFTDLRKVMFTDAEGGGEHHFSRDVVRATSVAMDYRQRFRKDVIIDYICFRKYGHNELDDPSFTQPIMYKVIRNRASIPDLYADKLVADNICSSDDLSRTNADWTRILNENYAAMASEQIKTYDLQQQWAGYQQAPNSITSWDTGVPVDVLKLVGAKSVTIPADVAVHPTIQKTHIERRLQRVTEGAVLDWATAEALAMGSLIYQGFNVRISGQDVGRATFSHRHAMIVDQKTDEVTIPLNSLTPDQCGFLEVANSALSEEAVLGFEYGMSIDNPRTLVIWEAQFGDFFNGAQSIIDTYVTSGENKWLLQSGLVMLLPHGMDGAGPEHSSCRMERFLQGCDSSETDVDGDNVNIQIVNPTTPAQYFHLLRRQMIRDYRKPLVVAAPKILLRLPAATSSLTDMAPGTAYMPVIGDPVVKGDKVTKVVFCSGKHFYNIKKERDSRKLDNMAIIRLESLCPFPAGALQAEIGKYPNAQEFIWTQEEHRNMGPWSFVSPRFENIVGCKLQYVGRDVLGLPAVGIGRIHQAEAGKLITDLFG